MINGGGVAPAKFLSKVVQDFYNEENGYARKYRELDTSYKKQLFLLEYIRLDRMLPMVAFVAHKKKPVTMFGEEIEVPDGTPMHCSAPNANRDGKVLF